MSRIGYVCNLKRECPIILKEKEDDLINSLNYQDEFDSPIEEESFEYDYEDFLQSQMPPSFNEIFQHCLLPTIESVKGHVGKLIICCIIFRISSQLCKFFSNLIIIKVLYSSLQTNLLQIVTCIYTK